MRTLAGKVAVITWGTSGIGLPPLSASSRRWRTSASPSDGHVSSMRRRRQSDSTSRSARRARRTGPRPRSNATGGVHEDCYASHVS
jgi:hypothetical protein